MIGKRKFNEFEAKSNNNGESASFPTVKLAPTYPTSLSSPFYDNDDNYDFNYNREAPSVTRSPIVASDRHGNFHGRRSTDSLNINGRRVAHPKRTVKARRLDPSIDTVNHDYMHNHSLNNNSTVIAHQTKQISQTLTPSFANATRCQNCMRRPNLWSSENLSNNECETRANNISHTLGSTGVTPPIDQSSINGSNSSNVTRLWKCNLCTRDTCSNCLIMCDGCDIICCSNCVIDIGVNSDGGHVCSVCMQQQTNPDNYWPK